MGWLSLSLVGDCGKWWVHELQVIYHALLLSSYNRKKYSRGAFLYTSFKSKEITFTRALLSWLLSWAMWVGRHNLFCYIHQAKKSSSLCVLRRRWWWHFQSLTSHYNDFFNLFPRSSSCTIEIQQLLDVGYKIVNMTLKALSLTFLNKKLVYYEMLCVLSQQLIYLSL